MSSRVSVVIPTRDRETRLAFALEALAAQTLPADSYEVIVVRDGDAGPRLAPAPDGLEVRFLTRDGVSGPTAKRNLGWRAASGELVAFTDDDCRPASDWLEQLWVAHARHPEGFLQGVTRVDADEEHLLHGLARSRSVLEPSDWYEASNIVYPRPMLEALGGFDESFTFGAEDTDLALRARAAGARRVFLPEAVVEHAVLPRSPLRAVREAGRWSSVPLLFARHPGHRKAIFAGVFHKETHAYVLLAALGLLGPWRRRWGPVAVAPYVLFNLDRHQLGPRGLARQLVGMPSRFSMDFAETAATVRSAIRHRTLVI